ncbi:class I SAM-dependent methyltransferase [Yoonia litorea]|uniref:Methyltransferase domain-containing protein n=1 Tax=Yoonia litorea TaxID=1123755 RepID=A0A1I6L8W2_9RHOB|nr:class I SAM-dependent methyltransferase [Yoonia litorea]SFR99872.1 Methyltransferase domain-containing protein [Yoonia litorea]
MADPFQDVDAAGADFIRVFADAMDARQADPAMEAIVAAYLSELSFPAGSLTIEVGAGAGAVSRRIAARAAPSRVIGFEPSIGFVNEARARAKDHDNLSFEVADGSSLPVDDGSVDHVIMHTVLTHVLAPEALIAEAHRVLKPGGVLVVCDADFSKGSFASFPNDPLDICARAFEAGFVTDPYLVAKLKTLVAAEGFETPDFRMTSRLVQNGPQMLPWVTETTKLMVANGQIGQQLADALVAEYERRMNSGTLYGYQAFGTLRAGKPVA